MSSRGVTLQTNGWAPRVTLGAVHVLWLVTLVLAGSGGQGGGSQVSAFCVTSIAAMRSLVSQEAKLISHLGKLLDLATSSDQRSRNSARIHHLRRRLQCICHNHEAMKETAFAPIDPVSGFRLVRRLRRDWSQVTKINQSEQSFHNDDLLQANLEAMQDAISQWRLWPKAADEEGAALALIRIGHTYQLYPSLEFSSNSIQRSPKRPFWQSSITSKSFQSMMGDDPTSGTPDHPEKTPSTIDSDSPSSSTSWPEGQSHIRRSSKSIDDLQSSPSCLEHDQTLSTDDVSFITNTAITHGYYTEAKQWYNRMSKLFYHNAGGPAQSQEESNFMLLRNKLEAVSRPSSSVDSSSDDVTDNYIRLCRKSIESHQRELSSSLQCTWRNTWPYLRHKMEILHRSPDVYIFYDVISDSEIDHIQGQANGKLLPSMLDDTVSTHASTATLGWRSSHTAWLGDQTPVLRAISHRVGQMARLLTVPLDAERRSEPYQVVNYGLGGLYGPHLDTLYTSQRHGGQTRNQSFTSAGDRLATWMFYLSDVKLGGATVFPLLNLDIKPIKGSAVLWYNLHRSGLVDHRMVHAGCPVVEGDKWVANKWIRERAQWQERPCDLRSWE